MSDVEELVTILNQAIEVEYGALFLMPQHIAQLQDPELAAALREACRDELEHAETTARLIYALGGIPKGDFKLLRPMSTPQEMLRAHIEGERRVIELYRRAAAKARRPEHKDILRRLLADEANHQATFTRLLSQLE
ncbi:MAG TPA: ferritin-like domain-containing protein [Armatimonadota bacterium]|nr:ferritin-like domain-containing protein [Armatimonadota bacterium]